MLLDSEILIIKEFKQSKIPSIYKTDNTDNILYVEHVDFDLCNELLKGKKVDYTTIQNEIYMYSNFLSQISIIQFDKEAIEYFKLINSIFEIFLKYNL